MDRHQKNRGRMAVVLLLATAISLFTITKLTYAETDPPDGPQAPSDTYLGHIPVILFNQGVAPEPTPPPIPEGSIVVDHRAVDQFEHIPEQYLDAARNTPMLFSDRSVGANIDDALNCLAAATAWYDTPASCRRDYYDTSGSTWLWKTYNQDDYLASAVPERILFDPDPTRFNRSNWTFEYRQGDWPSLLENFVRDLVPSYVNAKEVLSFQYSYLNIEDGSSIDDADVGFFVDLPHYGHYPNNIERWDISDLEDLEAQHPEKVFIYWTTSLARGIGTVDGENFNNQMRDYALTNGKVLFDVADIQSRDENGDPCYDNRDGVQYCSGNSCENHPDDGVEILAICQDYTTETDGGHLGSVSAGKIRIAKAFWVLMARIAGWDGQTN
jgi:hypothetical protein